MAALIGTTNGNQLEENLQTIRYLNIFTSQFKEEINLILDNDPIDEYKGLQNPIISFSIQAIDNK